MAGTEKDPISSATAARLVFLLQPREVVWSNSYQTGNPFIKSLWCKFREPGSQFQQNTEKNGVPALDFEHIYLLFSRKVGTCFLSFTLLMFNTFKKKCLLLFSADALQPHPENLECCCSSFFSRLSVSFMNQPLLQIRSRWCRHPSVAGMVSECNDSLSCQRPVPVQ